MIKLGDRGRNLEALVENNLLALEANVFWPLDEAGKILLGLNILACRRPNDIDSKVIALSVYSLTDTKVTRVCLEKWVLGRGLRLASGRKRRCSGLLSGLGFWGLVIEHEARSAIVIASKERAQHDALSWTSDALALSQWRE